MLLSNTTRYRIKNQHNSNNPYLPGPAPAFLLKCFISSWTLLLISLPQMEPHQHWPPPIWWGVCVFGTHSGRDAPSLSLKLPETGQERRWTQIRGLYLGPIGRWVKLKVKIWNGGPSARSGSFLLSTQPPDVRLRLSPHLHLLGLILDDPDRCHLNEKDESGTYWENTWPSSPSTTASLSPHAVCSALLCSLKPSRSVSSKTFWSGGGGCTAINWEWGWFPFNIFQVLCFLIFCAIFCPGFMSFHSCTAALDG